MFRRTFWFTAGAVTGVWATTKAQRLVRGLTPESLAATAVNRAVDAGRRAKLFAEDVRSAMAERETQLNDALGLDRGSRPAELPGPRLKALPGRPKHPYTTYNRKEDL
ncbi:hypothetical protein SRB5_20260 [Streptomyces sp. RB5]|uniref:Secreted protein n=1 Tax=Streptomyces smaragdinus TaxID=2585196 RepID=A0A7K0CEK6_9ACTN|nr:DUF6167 family protein [Streptomyces smaragdinus]MQY11907.1 hypothetical protein [Streptomyces smaragdinus]